MKSQQTKSAKASISKKPLLWTELPTQTQALVTGGYSIKGGKTGGGGWGWGGGELYSGINPTFDKRDRP